MSQGEKCPKEHMKDPNDRTFWQNVVFFPATAKQSRVEETTGTIILPLTFLDLVSAAKVANTASGDTICETVDAPKF